MCVYVCQTERERKKKTEKEKRNDEDRKLTVANLIQIPAVVYFKFCMILKADDYLLHSPVFAFAQVILQNWQVGLAIGLQI